MDDGGAIGKHLKAKSNASNNKRVVFRSVISTVISDHGNTSRPDSETNLKGTGHGSGKDSDSSDTESSTSSNSTSDDFIQLNPQIPSKFRVPNNIPKPNGGTKPLHKNEKFDVSIEALYRVKESNNESPKSIPRVSDVTHESLVPHMSPTQSPPIQVMERSGGFDPNRIPASIFSRPSTTPMDWSVASNDSLFSIHIGNSSFSRDHVTRMGVDLQKSGELPKSGEFFNSEEVCESGEPSKSVKVPQSKEVYNSGELYQSREHFTDSDLKRSGELIGFGQTFPATKGVGHKKSSDMPKTIGDDMSSGEIEMINEHINYIPMALTNNQVDTNKGGSIDASSANHRHSHKFETTIQTPFPRKKKSSCLPCHCSDCCKWSSSCCKWSSCSCKWICWPSCSFKWFVWPSCSKNCLRWKSCCCKWSCCCCKCFSWPSCKCASWPSCKFQCSNCTWACCYCWNREPKRVCCESSHVVMDGRITTCKIGCPEHQHAMPPNSVKGSSKKRWSCFSCSSTCSCCACCSCSCCC